MNFFLRSQNLKLLAIMNTCKKESQEKQKCLTIYPLKKNK